MAANWGESSADDICCLDVAVFSRDTLKQGAADEVKLRETKLWDGEVAVTSRIKASMTVVSGCLLESALRRTEADIRG